MNPFGIETNWKVQKGKKKFFRWRAGFPFPQTGRPGIFSLQRWFISIYLTFGRFLPSSILFHIPLCLFLNFSSLKQKKKEQKIQFERIQNIKDELHTKQSNLFKLILGQSVFVSTIYLFLLLIKTNWNHWITCHVPIKLIILIWYDGCFFSKSNLKGDRAPRVFIPKVNGY